MTSPAQRIATQINDIQRRLTGVERGPQLALSTVQIGGEDVLLTDALAAGLAAEVNAAEALASASTALARADGAVAVFYGGTEPTTANVGDFWVNDDGQTSIYSGSLWEPVTSSLVADALAAARNAEAAVDGKVTSFFAAEPPTAEAVGDMWFDTDNGNALSRWDGTAWISVRDLGIDKALADAAAAKADAGTSLTTANGKGKVWFQDAAPTPSSTADLWFKTNEGNRLYKPDGSGGWTSFGLADQALSSLNVGKLVAGTLSAQYVVVAGRLTTRYDGSQTGARVELDSAGFRAYDANGTNTLDVKASDGSATFKGAVSTGNDLYRIEMGPSLMYGSSKSLNFYGGGGNPAQIYGDNAGALNLLSGPDNLGFSKIALDPTGPISFTAYDSFGAGGLRAQVHSTGMGVWGNLNVTQDITVNRLRPGANSAFISGIYFAQTNITTDANGMAIISHPLGATPASVICQVLTTGGGAWWVAADTFTASSFRVRALKPGATAGTVAVAPSQALTIGWIAVR